MKGVAANNLADTLDAKGSFTVTAAADVTAASLKSDAGAGSVTATNGAVTVGNANTAASFGVNASGAIGLTNVTTGTTFDATSTGSTVALGTAKSGGTQTIEAKNDIAFSTLRTTGIAGTAGDVTLESSDGSIFGGDIFAAGSITTRGRNVGFGSFTAGRDATLIATGNLNGNGLAALGTASLTAGGALSVSHIRATNLALTTPVALSIGSLDVGSDLALAADTVSVGTVNAAGSLSLTLTGYNGGIGTQASLYVNAPSIVVPSLRFTDTSLATSASFVGVQSATVPGSLRLSSPYATIAVNDRSSLPRAGSTVQLFQPSQNFFIYQNVNTTYTNAYVVQYARGSVVNGDVVGAQNANPSFVNDLPRFAREGNDGLIAGMLPSDGLFRWTQPMAAFTDYLPRLDGVTPPVAPSEAVNLENSDKDGYFLPGTLLIVPSTNTQRP